MVQFQIFERSSQIHYLPWCPEKVRVAELAADSTQIVGFAAAECLSGTLLSVEGRYPKDPVGDAHWLNAATLDCSFGLSDADGTLIISIHFLSNHKLA